MIIYAGKDYCQLTKQKGSEYYHAQIIMKPGNSWTLMKFHQSECINS